MNSDIVEEDNDHFCLADLAQLFSKFIPPEGKTSKHKENKASVRNAEGRLMACIHFLIYVHLWKHCNSNMRWPSFILNTKVLIGSEN